MIITWNPGTLVTLVDDVNKLTGIIESWTGSSIVQEAPLYAAAIQVLNPLGNVRGDFVFTARKSFGTRTLALQALATEYARINGQGTLLVTQDSATLTMANAVLKQVALVRPNGLEFTFRYTFEMTTLVSS